MYENKYINFDSDEYSFIKKIPNIIYLTLGGSYAYGTNTPSSDIDLRGIALNSAESILTGRVDFEQYINEPTDTVIYGFNKIIQLLMQCNPNCIELLFTNDDTKIYVSEIGQELLNIRKAFLSKRCIKTFGGYAESQARRLCNKEARNVSQPLREDHILSSLKNGSYDFSGKYNVDTLLLYTDYVSDNEKDIFLDINLKKYPLRDYLSMYSELSNIVRDYDKQIKRNKYAIEHNKISKHAMHLIRLYMMCVELLSTGDVHTYRKDEHDLLMDVRNGKYTDADGHMTKDFDDIVDKYKKEFDYAVANTNLPSSPDIEIINDFVICTNRNIIKKYDI